MNAAISTICLYPKNLEDALYDLALCGARSTEIYFSTFSETKKVFVSELCDIMERFDIKCFSCHPFTFELENSLLFSDNKRKTDDFLDFSKYYFESMNLLGAKYLVLHGSRKNSAIETKKYCEIYERLKSTALGFGVDIAQENVSGCKSGDLGFLKELKAELGNDLNIMLDIKHAVRAKKDPLHFVSVLGKNIVGCHFSDYSEYGDCLIPGHGRMDTYKFLSALNKKNPNAEIILEIYKKRFDSVSELMSGYNLLSAACEKITKPIFY